MSPSPRSLPQGLLEDDAQISVPPNNSFITCFPNSPPAAYGNPCGSFYSSYTSYPGGVALSQGWQERLCPAEPERYAHPDQPDHEPASRVRRSASATRRTAS